MTAIGEKGRLAPGESWRRAMGQVHQLHRDGSKRRYRVRGWQVEPGWWAYQVSKHPSGRFLRYVATLDEMVHRRSPGPSKPQPMTRGRIAELSARLPRCAQRARSLHGGDSKVAWPSKGMAWEVASALGHHAYPCDLPAPAIGEHWHTSRSKRRRGR